MSADIINLNKIRKQKARTDKTARASQNRIRFGRTKAEKRADRAEADKTARHTDGHQLGADDDPAEN